MTGKPENRKGLCPLCGGRLAANQRATIPFVLGKVVVVVKDVPAEVCQNCSEAFLSGMATDQLVKLLERFVQLPVAVSVTSYSELMSA